nr:MAG TPA: hypothetical protein [Caudoviricetes sp.]
MAFCSHLALSLATSDARKSVQKTTENVQKWPKNVQKTTENVPKQSKRSLPSSLMSALTHTGGGFF